MNDIPTPDIIVACHRSAEASKPYFKERLVDADANSCLITKEGGSVEAITGATITSKAVTRSVSAAIKYVTNMG